MPEKSFIKRNPTLTRQERETRKKTRIVRSAILRLIAFPAAYVILWIPGMVNRSNFFFKKKDTFLNRIVLETAGVQNPYLVFAQSFTQLVGFVDAALCIWNLRAIIKQTRAEHHALRTRSRYP